MAMSAKIILDSSTSLETLCENFSKGHDLTLSRKRVENLQEQLEDAIAREDYPTASAVHKEILDLTSKDPETVARQLRERMDKEVADERYVAAANTRDELAVVKQHLPQYQLSGIWKGDYPSGEVMVRVRYEGDVLIATKESNSPYVPEGEVTFRVDLSKPPLANNPADGFAIEVATVQDDDRTPMPVGLYSGEGRISKKKNDEAHWANGALCLMGLGEEIFGFLWIPLGLFIVFKRPGSDDDDDDKAVKVEHVQA